jgi:hypothetical protein
VCEKLHGDATLMLDGALSVCMWLCVHMYIYIRRFIFI